MPRLILAALAFLMLAVAAFCTGWILSEQSRIKSPTSLSTPIDPAYAKHVLKRLLIEQDKRSQAINHSKRKLDIGNKIDAEFQRAELRREIRIHDMISQRIADLQSQLRTSAFAIQAWVVKTLLSVSVIFLALVTGWMIGRRSITRSSRPPI